jgi:hypothetical protein
MAYGKNKERKEWAMKSIPLAVGQITDKKQAELSQLYEAVLALMKQMASECFFQEPLDSAFAAFPLEKRLVHLQQSHPTLNQVWAEQARMRVKPALDEAHKRYFKRLVGGLRFVDSEIDDAVLPEGFVGPLPLRRRYFNVPVEIQDQMTEGEFKQLKAWGESQQALTLLQQVIVHGDYQDLTPHQIAILRDIHARAQARHRPPHFAAGSDFTLQLTLDYRMLPSVKRKDQPDAPSEALRLRSGEAYLLKDDSNRLYRRFIAIAGIKPRDPRIAIPVLLTRSLSHRLASTRQDYAALTLELGRDALHPLQVGMRLVCGKPKPELSPSLNAVSHAVGRDYGYKNTICLSVIESDRPIDLESHIPALAIKAKEDAKAILENTVMPGHVRVLERRQFSGANFLQRINVYCEKIEAYTSRIDRAYNELSVIKGRIFNRLHLSDGEFIDKAHGQTQARNEVMQFLNKFDQIHSLKKERRRCYKKIAAIKKNWFGFLSNQEVNLAKANNAVIVREHLTVEALEKDQPEYKGRRFNKMINHGAKGQYQNQASDKLTWNGIPELVIGSWYTSLFCSQHGQIVSKSHRQGDKIYLPCCDKHDHADLHASETIALMPFLVPKSYPASAGS